MDKKSTRIIFSVTDAENQLLTERAQKCGLSKSAYIREQALSGQVINSLPEARANSIMAELYTLSEEIKDVEIRKMLREGANQLWQSLK